MAYDISFHLNKTLITTFLDFRCGILNCLFEVKAFECTLSEKNIGVYSNETSSKKEDENKRKDTNGENELCRGNKI